MINTIGIDLGTYNSAAFAVVDGDVVQVQLPDDGLMRSAIWWDGTSSFLAGQCAANKMGESPAPLLEFKRSMGFNTKLRLGGHTIDAVEASGRFLGELRRQAIAALEKDYPGNEIKLEHAVISHPAQFGVAARNDTINAGLSEWSGFTRVDLIPEPVAAAAAIVYRGIAWQDVADAQYYLVFDFGGGTLDVAIVQRSDEGLLNVIDYDGDQWLGGSDFDTYLAALLEAKFNAGRAANDRYYFGPAVEAARFAGIVDKRDQTRPFASLCYFAEKIKQELSAHDDVKISPLGKLCDDRGTAISGEWEISRLDFETDPQIQALMARALDCVERILARQVLAFPGQSPLDAEACQKLSDEERRQRALQNAQFVEVILVGGSSRMPMVERLFRERFARQAVLHNPDLVVADGAAQQGRLLNPLRVFATNRPDVRLHLTHAALTNKAKPYRISAEVDGPPGQYRLDLDDTYGNSVELALQPKEAKCADLELVEDTVNKIEWRLVDGAGDELMHDDLYVEHSRRLLSQRPFDVTNALPVKVLLASGPFDLVPANSKIPHEDSCLLWTVDDSATVLMTFFEGDRFLGEVAIENQNCCPGVKLGLVFKLHLNYQFSVTINVPEGAPIQMNFTLARAEVPDVQSTRTKMVKMGSDLGKALVNWRGTKTADECRVLERAICMEIETELAKHEPRPGFLSAKLNAYRLLVERMIQIQPPKPPIANYRGRNLEHLTGEQTAAWLDALRHAEKAWEDVDATAYEYAIAELDRIMSEAPKIITPNATIDPNELDEAQLRLHIVARLDHCEAQMGERWPSAIASYERDVRWLYYGSLNLRQAALAKWRAKSTKEKSTFRAQLDEIKRRYANAHEHAELVRILCDVDSLMRAIDHAIEHGIEPDWPGRPDGPGQQNN